jgi:hypothetical protein
MHGSAAARFLGLRFRIPPRTRLFVSCDCLLLSRRRLCDRPITRPEESYGFCVCVCVCVSVCVSVCLIVCDPESLKEAAWARFGS